MLTPLSSLLSRRSLRDARAHGFTLVELLMVFAILLVLVALLLPSLRMLQNQADKATCASNLKQCGGAILAYAAEYGFMPSPDASGAVPQNQQENSMLPLARRWSLQLRKAGYLGSDDISKWYTQSWATGSFPWNADYFSKKTVSVCPACRWDSKLAVDTGNYDYGIRVWYGPDEDVNALQKMIRANTVDRDLPFLADTIMVNQTPWRSSMQMHPSHNDKRIYLRHDGVANAWYADGSVRQINDTELARLKDKTGIDWVGFKDPK